MLLRFKAVLLFERITEEARHNIFRVLQGMKHNLTSPAIDPVDVVGGNISEPGLYAQNPSFSRCL